MQEVIIIILFLGALVYLGNLLYKHIKGDAGCASNCCDSPVKNLKNIKR